MPIALLSANHRFPVSLLRLPPPPLPRLLPTPLAAIALARSPRMKTLFTPLQQTGPTSRPPCPALPPASRLLFARACKTLGRWVMTPRSPALEGNATPLQGAVQQQKTSGSSLKAHYNGKRPCRPRGALLLPQHRLWPLTYRLPGLPFGSRGGSFLESAEDARCNWCLPQRHVRLRVRRRVRRPGDIAGTSARTARSPRLGNGAL